MNLNTTLHSRQVNRVSSINSKSDQDYEIKVRIEQDKTV